MRRKAYLRRTKPLLGVAIAALLCTGLVACWGGGQSSRNDPTDDTAIYEERLILNNATLENADEAGEILWRVKVGRTTYEPDEQNADLEEVTGNFYQDGEIVLKLKADRGKIIDDGQQIILQENIVATDPRTGVVLQCQEIQWSPDDGIMVARKSLQGGDDEMTVTAKQGKYFTRTQVLEMVEEVVVNGKKTPMQVRTEKAVWDLPKQTLVSDRTVEIDRYKPQDNPTEATTEIQGDSNAKPEVTGEDSTLEGEIQDQPPDDVDATNVIKPESELQPDRPKPEVTDRIVAQSAQFDLERQVVVLKDKVESRSVEPPLQIASNSIVWNIPARTVLSNAPVRVVNRADSITLTANEGLINLEDEVLRLNGGARGINTRRPADLYANQIIWYLERERIEAAGNVIYRQADPPLDLSGARAVGQLKAQKITVTGGEGSGRVLTKIVP